MTGATRGPGEQRIPDAAGQPASTRDDRGIGSRWARPSLLVALLAASAVALLAAAGWAILRGIFELGPGSLVVALLGGWGIGVWLRRAGASPLLAGAMGLGGWLLGLLFTWLLAMAILPGSTRSWLERIEGTPFVDWLAPQFGLLELSALVLWVGAAVYTARPARQARA
jgi:hypothetical protein